MKIEIVSRPVFMWVCTCGFQNYEWMGEGYAEVDIYTHCINCGEETVIDAEKMEEHNTVWRQRHSQNSNGGNR